MNDLYKAFHKYFEVVIADTPSLLEVVFRMRYQKLCIDMSVPGYESSLYPDGQEKDNYDDHSSHVLIRHRQTNEYIGTTRLIMFDKKNPKKLFPVERYALVDSDFYKANEYSRQHTGEISRFLIIKKFERRKGERRNFKTRKPEEGAAERRLIKNLTLVLAAGIVRLSAQYEISNWFTIMDPALNRLLNYYSLGLDPIGPEIQHYGLRRPYYGKLTKIFDRMKLVNRNAWEVVTEYGKYSDYLSKETYTGIAEVSDCIK